MIVKNVAVACCSPLMVFVGTAVSLAEFTVNTTLVPFPTVGDESGG